MTNINVEKFITSDLIDYPKNISDKITIEKRRRHQTYMALDYFLSEEKKSHTLTFFLQMPLKLLKMQNI